MNAPTSPREAAHELALTFQLIAPGPLPRVVLLGRDYHGRPTVMVGYHGDELVRCMQIEAFIIKAGDVIIQRSKAGYGITFLIYCQAKK